MTMKIANSVSSIQVQNYWRKHNMIKLYFDCLKLYNNKLYKLSCEIIFLYIEKLYLCQGTFWFV